MGAFLARQWSAQGYYCDMVEGYISRAGGSPHMIHFPKELQKLPARCPFCCSSSNLRIEEMRCRLAEERKRYRHHIDKIIAARVAEGKSHPYPSFNNTDREQQLKQRYDSRGLFRYLKRNSILPEETTSSENIDDPFYFPFHISDIIVCNCMDLPSTTEMHVPEEDEQKDEKTVVISSNSRGNLEEDTHTEGPVTLM